MSSWAVRSCRIRVETHLTHEEGHEDQRKDDGPDEDVGRTEHPAKGAENGKGDMVGQHLQPGTKGSLRIQPTHDETDEMEIHPVVHGSSERSADGEERKIGCLHRTIGKEGEELL